MTFDRTALCSSLKEFGLNTYEAKVYVTLLHDGPLLVGDLAHRARIPRTKAYPTVKSLQRKGLVRLNNKKPVRCFPRRPDECLAYSISEATERVEELKRTMATVTRIANRRGNHTLTEARNSAYSSQELADVLPELITSSYQRIYCILDSWGIRLLEGVISQIRLATSSGVKVKCLYTHTSTLSSEANLPRSVERRVGKYPEGSSIIIIDDEKLLVVNSVLGLGLLIQSRDLVKLNADLLFESIWRNAIPESQIPIVSSKTSANELLALILTSDLESILANAAYESISDYQLLGDIGLRIITTIENRYGFKLLKEPPEDIIPVISGVMAETLKSYSDSHTGQAPLQSAQDSTLRPAVWWFILMGLLKRNGLSLDTFGEFETTEAAQLMQTVLPTKLP